MDMQATVFRRSTVRFPNGFDEEVIEIDVDGKISDTTNYKSLPPKAKLTINPAMDENS